MGPTEKHLDYKYEDEDEGGSKQNSSTKKSKGTIKVKNMFVFGNISYDMLEKDSIRIESSQNSIE